MTSVTRHIERVREQPEHIRKQIALGIAAVATVLVACVWLIGSLAMNTFALSDTSFKDSVAKGNTLEVTSGSSRGLLGAAGSAFAPATSSAPHLEVLESGNGNVTVKKPKEPTIIPF